MFTINLEKDLLIRALEAGEKQIRRAADRFPARTPPHDFLLNDATQISIAITQIKTGQTDFENKKK